MARNLNGIAKGDVNTKLCFATELVASLALATAAVKVGDELALAGPASSRRDGPWQPRDSAEASPGRAEPVVAAGDQTKGSTNHLFGVIGHQELPVLEHDDSWVERAPFRKVEHGRAWHLEL